MTDRDDIEDLMVLYTEALDDARFADLGTLFASGSVRIEGGPHGGASAEGAGEVAALYERIVALDDAGRTGTRHFISNIIVRVDGDTATGRSYFAVTQQTAALPLQIVACGAYRDTYRRTGGAWEFATRHIVCDQVGELAQHMR